MPSAADFNPGYQTVRAIVVGTSIIVADTITLEGTLAVVDLAGPVDIGNDGSVVVLGTTAITGNVTLAGTGTVRVAPRGLTVAQSGGTIAAGGTFQAALALNAGRIGGLIQNTGTGTLEVFFGPTASASSEAALILAPLAERAFSLGVNQGVYTGVVAVNGATDAPFVTIENT